MLSYEPVDRWDGDQLDSIAGNTSRSKAPTARTSFEALRLLMACNRALGGVGRETIRSFEKLQIKV